MLPNKLLLSIFFDCAVSSSGDDDISYINTEHKRGVVSALVPDGFGDLSLDHKPQCDKFLKEYSIFLVLGEQQKFPVT